MKLLVSVVDAHEAQEAILGGASIIDIKNPREGSLGAQPPLKIAEIVAVIPRGIESSAAIGDVPNLPGTAALATVLAPDLMEKCSSGGSSECVTHWATRAWSRFHSSSNGLLIRCIHRRIRQ